MRVAAALTASLLVALVASTAAHAAPTKHEFIRKGDALCADVVRQLAPIRRRAEAAKSLPESKRWSVAADIWTDQIAVQRRFNDRFRAIGTPPGDTAARRLVASLGRGLVLARRVRDAFVHRDHVELALAVPDYVEFTVALNRRVAAYGFRVCGRA